MWWQSNDITVEPTLMDGTILFKCQVVMLRNGQIITMRF